MTIISKVPLTLAETKEIVDKLEEKQELKDYFKKFTKVKKEESEKLRKDLVALNNLKMKEENIVKIIDIMPTEPEELNKIMSDTSLTEEETHAILDTIKKY
jgi:DNA-directed RNA polymerase subunit F